MRDFSAMKAAMEVGEKAHGFVVKQVVPLPRLRMMAYVCEHEATGARVAHFHADDAEQLFAIAVRTPPADDTGLPHIVEHTVLCGSRKYPVKEPFTELLKTSLATYLNAFTAYDMTIYPCASMNRKDFYNLASVYCDAVFHPRLLREHFQQEGHHYELNEAGELTIKGVVYNEMKGYYAELSDVVTRQVRRQLFEGSCYAHDAGGDPAAIPSLTYEQFKAFHAAHYHVGNASFFFYGSLPTEEHLAFLAAECLGDAERRDAAALGVPVCQCRARRVTVPYPIAAHESPERRAAHVAAFLTHDIEDTVMSLALQILDYYLLGNEAAPLRRALIESRIGSATIHTGLMLHQRLAYFGIGLRGSGADQADAFWERVQETLKKIIRDGLDKERIKVALYQRELALRSEVCMSSAFMALYPATAWLYGLPLDHFFHLDEDVAQLHERLRQNPRYLEEVLEEMLVRNERYCLVTCVPDREYFARQEAKQREQLAARLAELSAAEREQIRAEAVRLAEMQVTPDPPEAKATLPRLRLAEVSREPLLLPRVMEAVGSATLIATDVFTNGLAYVALAVDLRGLEEELWEYVPVYMDAVTKVGAGGLDFAALAEREAACCAGIAVTFGALRRRDDQAAVRALLQMGTTALARELPRALEVMEERLLRVEFGDIERLRNVLRQLRTRMRDSMPDRMTEHARWYSARSFSAVAALQERVNGLTGARAIERVVGEFEQRHEGVIEKLERIRAYIAAHRAVCLSIAGADESVQQAREWLAALQTGAQPVRAAAVTVPARPENYLGVSIAAQVAANALSIPLEMPGEAVALMMLLGQQLTYGYLWERVRMQGSAYHAAAWYRQGAGVFGMISGDDPHIARTLEIYKGVCDYIENEMDLSASGMEQAIIGTLRRYDRPVRGMDASTQALEDWACGITPEEERRERARLLGLTGEDIRRLSVEQMRPAFERAVVSVVAGRELLARAQEALGPGVLVVEPGIGEGG